MTSDYFKQFISSYIRCALWIDDGPQRVEDIPDSEVDVMRKECVRFIWRARGLLERSCLSASRAGYLFWLTKNGHGSGFWDEDLGELGDTLTDLARADGPPKVDFRANTEAV